MTSPATREGGDAARRDTRGRYRRVLRRVGLGVAASVTVIVVVLSAGWVALLVHNRGTPSPAARTAGQDAVWLGHAWVDGRKRQDDVDALAEHLRDTGIRHVFVHSGPLRHDGTLDPALHPRSRWFVTAMHAAMPDVRVQAWLGQVVGPGRMNLSAPQTRAGIVASAGAMLDEGFDGIHYDFEPVTDGDRGLLDVLSATRTVTRARQALLSVAAIHLEPVRGVAAVAGLLPRRVGVWSAGYLREVSQRVDQVALMAYDSGMRTPSTYSGWVRRQTDLALTAVSPDVHLMIGVPAYHEDTFIHPASAETVAASLRGIRLALGEAPPRRPFGVAVYVDFTATAQDWEAYRRGWAEPPGEPGPAQG